MSPPSAPEFTTNGDGPPTKRRRTNMPPADGFAFSKPVFKVPVRQFTSAFETANPASVEKLRSEGTESMSLQKTVIEKRRHATILSREPADGVSNKPKSRNGPSLQSAQELHKALFPQKAPRGKPTSETRHHPPLPQVPLDLSSTEPTPETVALKQILPPLFPTSKVSSKPLKPLQQPAAPASRKLPPVKELRTISTTGLGQLNLSSQSATEELASILLHDQHPELSVTGGDDEAVAHRGLGLSPEKKGKNVPKFTRGGLAARASAYFSKSHTGLILWQKDVGYRINPPSELTASIVKVLHMPIPPKSSTKNAPTSPGIALCSLRQQNGDPHPSFKADHLYQVAFSFSNIATPERFVDGQVIRLYKPWQEVFLREDKDPHSHRFPASLPLPCSEPYSTPNILDSPISDIALICTRFLIAP